MNVHTITVEDILIDMFKNAFPVKIVGGATIPWLHFMNSDILIIKMYVIMRCSKVFVRSVEVSV